MPPVPSCARACLLATAMLLCVVRVGRAAEFYVNRHSWHSGIVIARTDIPAGAWPPGVVKRHFAGCRSLELGWGDREFYVDRHPTAWMAVGAALVPGPSVLHVAGFKGSAVKALPGAEFVRVECTRDELVALCRAIGADFERDAAGRAKSFGPGLYGDRSQFYAAHGSYWIGNTCNSWTLRKARVGGVPTRVGVKGTLSSGAVTDQVRRLVAGRADYRKRAQKASSRSQ